MSKFKVGDTVRCIRENYDSNVSIDDEKVVEEISGDLFWGKGHVHQLREKDFVLAVDLDELIKELKNPKGFNRALLLTAAEELERLRTKLKGTEENLDYWLAQIEREDNMGGD